MEVQAPSGIIGNPMTYVDPDNKQYVAVLFGIAGESGIGVAADIGSEDPTAGLGALGEHLATWPASAPRAAS